MQGSDSTIITIFIVSALIALVLVVVIVSFVLLYQRRVLQQKVSLQNMQVTFQKELLAAILESQEIERSRIAKDLHDSVGVMLSTLQLIIKGYGSRGETPEQKADMVAQSASIIDSTITTVRRISHDLLPPELEMMGLWSALEQAAWRISQVGSLQVDVDFSEYSERLPAGHEIIVYRIVQELLNNTIKHSGATRCRIGVKRRQDGFALSYSDNGKGISPELIDSERKGRRGLGLRSIESRAESLGASIVWDIHSGSGMSLEIVFTPPPANNSTIGSNEKN